MTFTKAPLHLHPLTRTPIPSPKEPTYTHLLVQQQLVAQPACPQAGARLRG